MMNDEWWLGLGLGHAKFLKENAIKTQKSYVLKFFRELCIFLKFLHVFRAYNLALVMLMIDD
jgi:hypothetical protein